MIMTKRALSRHQVKITTARKGTGRAVTAASSWAGATAAEALDDLSVQPPFDITG